MEVADVQKKSARIELTIKTISKEQVEEVVEILTQSMLKNIAYSYVFRNEKTRPKKLKYLLNCMVNLFSDQHGTYAVSYKRKVLATATCIRATYLKPSVKDLIKSKMLFMPFYMNPFELMRLWKISRKNLNYLKKIDRDLSFIHCCLLAVKMEGQQFYLGKKTVKHLLEELDVHKKPFVITTHGYKHIRFFQQFGFRIRYKYNIKNIENCIMIRG